MLQDTLNGQSAKELSKIPLFSTTAWMCYSKINSRVIIVVKHISSLKLACLCTLWQNKAKVSS